MQTVDLENLFLSHLPISGVNFEHNDSVEIMSGEHEGKFGSLVSICALEPEPIFLIELGSGFDIRALQSQIKLITP